MLVALSLTDAVYLYVNGGNSNGGGTGTSWSIVKVAADNSIVAMQLAVADFDGDGDRDVAAVGLFDRSCASCSPGKVRWYQNPGNVSGAWQAHSVAASLWGARSIAAADLTGDGLPDLVVGANEIGGNGNGLYWFRNIGNGTAWSAAMALDASLLQVESVLVHDVDSDGVIDVIAAGKNSNQVAWYENGRTGPDPAPAFTKRLIASPALPYGLALANLDVDVRVELVVTGSAGVFWYDPPPDPTATWGTANVVDASFGSGDNARIVALDANADGTTDLAVSSSQSAELRWYPRESGGGFTPRTLTTGYTGLTFVAGGDVDGDGRVDLGTSTYNFGGGTSWLAAAVQRFPSTTVRSARARRSTRLSAWSCRAPRSRP